MFASVVQIIGLAAICAGTFLISVPAAIVACGVALLVVGVALERR